METQTIYDDDVTNNDVLLLPIAESNLKVELGAVDLSSIVEGIEEDGDDDDININMVMTAPSPLMSNNMSISNNSTKSHPHSHTQSQSQSQSGSVSNKSPSLMQEHPQDLDPARGETKSHPSQPQSVTTADPLDATLDKDFLQHFGDIFSNENDDSPAPLENTNPAVGGNDFNAALTNIMPDPLPTVQFASKGHPGNNRFYVLLCMHRKEFLKAAALGSTKVCDQIAQKILKNICTDSVPNGRFLECNIKSWSQNSWRNIEHEKNIIEIVKWALKEPPKAELAHYFRPQAVNLRRQSSYDADKGQGPNSFSNSACSQIATFDSVSSRGLASPSKTNVNNKDSSSLNYDNHGHSSHNPSKVTSLWERSNLRRCSLDTYSEENWEDGSSHHGSNSSSSNQRASSPTDMKKKKVRGHKRGEHKNSRNGGLKRRGTISSNETARSKSRKKINLADLRFSVSGQLSKLVEEVFAPQQQQTETTCNSEASGSISKGGGLSSGVRNKRKSASASSMTSSINRLRNDMVQVNIQDNSETAVPGVVISQESTKVITRDGRNCSLGAYDVVLTADMKLHTSDHIGNNRFRTMLQMYRQTFHNPQTSLEDQTKICDEIINQVKHGKKGNGRFLRKNGDTWMEIETENISSLVLKFLQDCVVDLSLGLPSLNTATKLLTNPLEGKKGCYKQLHGAALESLKKSKKKKAFRGLDSRSIEKLQTQMLENRCDTN